VKVKAPLTELVQRTPQRMRADPSRTVAQFFVPGKEGFDHQESRASSVLDHVLSLREEDAQRALDELEARFDGRHRHLHDTWRCHYEKLADRLDPHHQLSSTRRLLIGATFTSEYAIEGAALCNPSMVPHPDQADAPPGGLRVVLSVRGIGEGHRSSIGFRTGTIDAGGEVELDGRPPFATPGHRDHAAYEKGVFSDELHRLGTDGECATFVLDSLGDRFSSVELEVELARLHDHIDTRKHVFETIVNIRRIAELTYGTRFSTDTALSERVLMPSMHAESNGMEDARFVRFTDDDGTVSYYASYTAYDGHEIRQQLLETTDFVAFRSAPLVGPAAANKGMALFPRKVGGRYAAMSRFDRERNSVALSDDLHQWGDATPVQAPTESWESLQLGNCGPPLETEAGWLALTHGVGPMRTYSIGAILLDLDDPTRVLGRLREPLLAPDRADEQDGYVPNVVYSCGGLVHAGRLVVPYGVGDAAIGVATVPLDELLDALVSSPT
jgi:predicted GH43/DUF377 family glycosyl hydrolase